MQCVVHSVDANLVATYSLAVDGCKLEAHKKTRGLESTPRDTPPGKMLSHFRDFESQKEVSERFVG